MRPTHIVVHCSASTWGTAIDIDQWHKARGWKGIGYHAVILNGMSKSQWHDPFFDGAISPGRPLDEDADLEPQEIGAHAQGWNNHTVAVCLIGTGKYTAKQFDSLFRIIESWMIRFEVPIDHVIGHSEIPGVAKACPVLNMDNLRDVLTKRAALMTP